jgi:hypothetical protein
LQWEPALQAELRAKTDAWFFIVDEGPGLSGSSLTCAAVALRQLGVARSRIVFLPAYRCDGAHFVNAVARQTWREHAQFVGDFDSAWLKGVAQGAELRELSAGAWRQKLGANAEDIACHPQHERRKYLALAGGGRRFMLRFGGLGSHGRKLRARAHALEPSGVTPRVLDFADGMLALEYLPAKISAKRPATADFIQTTARYLAFRRKRLDTGELAKLETLAEMAHQNIDAGLGPNACRPLAALARRASSSQCSAIVADARLLPHEWLTTPTGIRKADGFDHGDDHFYPGPCDIAWDIAGAIYELGLDASQRQSLVSCYVNAAADSTIAERLPFFEVAYLAHRFGYASLAAGTLAGTASGAQFSRLALRYRSALGARLREPSP